MTSVYLIPVCYNYKPYMSAAGGNGKEGGVRKDKVNNLGSKMCRGSDVVKEGPSLPAG